MNKEKFEQFTNISGIQSWWDSESIDIQLFLKALYKFAQMCYYDGYKDAKEINT
jgi:hypothetical protein